MLIAPGRIGTSSPELGVAVKFSDISNFSVICEYEDREIGFVPELSYGSHMFQDLVESQMFYVAIMDKEGAKKNIFKKDFWSENESIFDDILPEVANPFNIVRIYEAGGVKPLCLYADFKNERVTCGCFEEQS